MDEMPPQDPSFNPPPPPQPGTPPPASPPPLLTPPPIITLPPRAKANTCRAWKIVALVALVLLVFSLIGNLARVASVFSPNQGRTISNGEHQLEELYIEHRNTENKIAVVDVQGVITGQDLDRSGMGMVEYISQQLKAAAKDANVKAVILKVNSPGGEVLAADDISRAITKYQDDTGHPVVVSMGALAASGGYYVSAPCRWIVANELTITGSIGVIMHGYNYRKLMDKVGVLPETFKSGKFKDMLSGDQEPDLDKLSPEDRETRLAERDMVQALINETFAKFKSVVAAGRKAAHQANGSEGRPLADDWQNFADGRVLSGKQARDLGFVDELGGFDAALKRAKKIANISNASVIQYREPFNIGSLFGLLGKTETPAIKVDLGFNAPKLQAGYLYYITPTVLF